MDDELSDERVPLPTMLQMYRNDVHRHPGSHLDLPMMVAHSMCRRTPTLWPHLMDFIQEGNVELLRCVQVFNQEHPGGSNEHFRSYAAKCIRYAIYEYIPRIPTIYVSLQDRRIHFVNKEKEEELEILRNDISWEALYESMVMGEKEDPTAMQGVFLEAMTAQIEALLAQLPPRERQVLEMRYGVNTYLHEYEEIAQKLGITYRQVYRVETHALDLLSGAKKVQAHEQRTIQRRERQQERLQVIYEAHDGTIGSGTLAFYGKCARTRAIQFLREKRETCDDLPSTQESER